MYLSAALSVLMKLMIISAPLTLTLITLIQKSCLFLMVQGFPKSLLWPFCNFLLNLKRTTAGPDQLLFWLWRDFAFDLAPIISHAFNCSLRCQTVPTLWKMADIMPLPKETPFRTCNQLRPIPLTNIIMRLFERVVFRCELSNGINNSIGSD